MIGPKGIGSKPYICVFAFSEKEPVVLAAKPFLIDLSNVESFQIPSWVSLTQADLRLILGLIEIYLNNFCGAFILEVWIHPLFFSLFLINASEESLIQIYLALSIFTDS